MALKRRLRSRTESRTADAFVMICYAESIYY